jgi:hypothetical protein
VPCSQISCLGPLHSTTSSSSSFSIVPCTPHFPGIITPNLSSFSRSLGRTHMAESWQSMGEAQRPRVREFGRVRIGIGSIQRDKTWGEVKESKHDNESALFSVLVEVQQVPPCSKETQQVRLPSRCVNYRTNVPCTPNAPSLDVGRGVAGGEIGFPYVGHVIERRRREGNVIQCSDQGSGRKMGVKRGLLDKNS